MKKTLDERFTDLSDIVSEQGGRWPTTLAAILAVGAWGAAGPAMHFSDTWQLLINTPTTVIELFLGFLSLASTNRVQRIVMALLQEIRRDQKAESLEVHAIAQHEGVEP